MNHTSKPNVIQPKILAKTPQSRSPSTHITGLQAQIAYLLFVYRTMILVRTNSMITAYVVQNWSSDLRGNLLMNYPHYSPFHNVAPTKKERNMTDNFPLLRFSVEAWPTDITTIIYEFWLRSKSSLKTLAILRYMYFEGWVDRSFTSLQFRISRWMIAVMVKEDVGEGQNYEIVFTKLECDLQKWWSSTRWKFTRGNI